MLTFNLKVVFSLTFILALCSYIFVTQKRTLFYHHRLTISKRFLRYVLFYEEPAVFRELYPYQNRLQNKNQKGIPFQPANYYSEKHVYTRM